MRFRTPVLRGGKTATGLEVPPEIVERLGGGKRPPVRVTINGFTYRTTVAVMGGAFMVPLAAENRAGAGVAAGDETDVDIELDTEPRQVELPADLAEALDQIPGVRRRFDASSYTRRKEVVRSVVEAKTAETRQRRIAKAVATLEAEAKSAG